MLFCSRRVLCVATASTAASRVLSAETLLETVRNDPGQTSLYYSNRYFGGKSVDASVNLMLWHELKRFGLVTIDRREGPSAPPRWFPVRFSPRRSVVFRHRPEDEDLSVLREIETSEIGSGSPMTGEEDSASDPRLLDLIRALVEAHPGQDLSYYAQQLPTDWQRENAAAAFKELRETEQLRRVAVNEPGKIGFVWYTNQRTPNTGSLPS